jgi:hypothetical protein
MDAQVEQLFLMNASKLPGESLQLIKESLENCDPQRVMFAMSKLKDPTISIILSITLGIFGIDRFYINSVGMGLGKLLTCGGIYIWWLIDIFLIMDATKQKNYDILMMSL